MSICLKWNELQQWNELQCTEVDKTKWGTTTKDFYEKDEGRVFFSSISYLDLFIHNRFMGLLFYDTTQLKNGCTGWLNTYVSILKFFSY